ncbi:MAG: MFS transporter [Bacilli bacterium]
MTGFLLSRRRARYWQLHEDTRATALAIHQTALYALIVTCSCVSGYFETFLQSENSAGGGSFCLIRGIGIAWAVFLMFAMRDTPPPANSGAAEASAQKASLKDAFFVVFRKPSAVMLALGFGMMIYVDCGFKTWMPTFLQDKFGMDGAQAAFNAVIWHYIGAFMGVMAGGRITDKLASTRKTVRFEANTNLCLERLLYI